MKYTIQTVAALCLIALTFYSSCKKSASRTTTPTACGMLHGFTAPLSEMNAFDHGPYSYIYAPINLQTASPVVGTISASLCFGYGAAYNSSDNCH